MASIPSLKSPNHLCELTWGSLSLSVTMSVPSPKEPPSPTLHAPYTAPRCPTMAFLIQVSIPSSSMTAIVLTRTLWPPAWPQPSLHLADTLPIWAHPCLSVTLLPHLSLPTFPPRLPSPASSPPSNHPNPIVPPTHRFLFTFQGESQLNGLSAGSLSWPLVPPQRVLVGSIEGPA